MYIEIFKLNRISICVYVYVLMQFQKPRSSSPSRTFERSEIVYSQHKAKFKCLHHLFNSDAIEYPTKIHQSLIFRNQIIILLSISNEIR